MGQSLVKYKTEATKFNGEGIIYVCYVSFDAGESWYAIGYGDNPLSAQKIIEWYRPKHALFAVNTPDSD